MKATRRVYISNRFRKFKKRFTTKLKGFGKSNDESNRRKLIRKVLIIATCSVMIGCLGFLYTPTRKLLISTGSRLVRKKLNEPEQVLTTGRDFKDWRLWLGVTLGIASVVVGSSILLTGPNEEVVIPESTRIPWYKDGDVVGPLEGMIMTILTFYGYSVLESLQVVKILTAIGLIKDVPFIGPTLT